MNLRDKIELALSIIFFIALIVVLILSNYSIPQETITITMLEPEKLPAPTYYRGCMNNTIEGCCLTFEQANTTLEDLI